MHLIIQQKLAESSIQPNQGTDQMSVNFALNPQLRKTDSNVQGVEDKDALQAGKNMVCGGYVLYGYCTIMVLAFEGGSVNGFTLDNVSAH